MINGAMAFVPSLAGYVYIYGYVYVCVVDDHDEYEFIVSLLLFLQYYCTTLLCMISQIVLFIYLSFVACNPPNNYIINNMFQIVACYEKSKIS
jgi:hypothetical protein